MKVSSGLFWSSLVFLTLAEQILFFAKNLDSSLVTQLATLDYNSESGNSELSLDATDLAPGSYCMGTSYLPQKECFVFFEHLGLISGDFVVYVDEELKISDISFISGGNELKLRVASVVSNVVPNLTPFHKKEPVKQPTTQKVTRKRVVENENGEKVEIEEEIEEIVPEDDRLWIQKNWMYIVPPLLLFMVFAPEDSKE